MRLNFLEYEPESTIDGSCIEVTGMGVTKHQSLY